MIFTKNTCLNQTFKCLALVGVVGAFALSGCQKKTRQIQVASDFFPVNTTTDVLPKTDAFEDGPVLFRIESQEQIGDDLITSILDPLEGDPILTCKQALFYEGDSLAANTNLFETPLVELTLIQASGGNGNFDSHYILYLNKNNDAFFNTKTQGIYEFSFSSATKNGFNINENSFTVLK